ncbi:helix-loop-helix domain-containing protein [Peribacillus frigoritolerans]
MPSTERKRLSTLNRSFSNLSSALAYIIRSKKFSKGDRITCPTI